MEEEPYERVRNNRNSQRRAATAINSPGNSTSFLETWKNKIKNLFGNSQPEPDEEYKELDIPAPFSGSAARNQLMASQPYQHTPSSLSSERRLAVPQQNREESKPEVNVLNINYYESPLAQRKSQRGLQGGDDEPFQETRRSRKEGLLHTQPSLQQQVDLCLEPISKSRRIKRKDSTSKKHPNLYAMIEMTQRLCEYKLSQHLKNAQRPGFVMNKTTWLSTIITKHFPKPKPVKPVFSEREKKYVPLFQFDYTGGKYNYKIIPGNWPKKRKFTQEDDRMSTASKSNWRQGPEGVFLQNAVALEREMSGHSGHKKMKPTGSKLISDPGNLERFQLSDYSRRDQRLSRNSPNSTRSKQIYFESNDSDPSQQEEVKKFEFQKEKYRDSLNPGISLQKSSTNFPNEDALQLEKQNARRLGEISLSNPSSNSIEKTSTIPKTVTPVNFPETIHPSAGQKRIGFNLGGSSSISEEKLHGNPVGENSTMIQEEEDARIQGSNQVKSIPMQPFKGQISEDKNLFCNGFQSNITTQQQNFNLFSEMKTLDHFPQKAPAMTLSLLSKKDSKHSLFSESEIKMNKSENLTSETDRPIVAQKTNIPPFSEASRLFFSSDKSNPTLEKTTDDIVNVSGSTEIKKAELQKNVFEQLEGRQPEEVKSYNLFAVEPLMNAQASQISEEAKETNDNILQNKPTENVSLIAQEIKDKTPTSVTPLQTAVAQIQATVPQLQNILPQPTQPTQVAGLKDNLNTESHPQKMSNDQQNSNDNKNVNPAQETSNDQKIFYNQKSFEQIQQPNPQTQMIVNQPQTGDQPIENANQQKKPTQIMPVLKLQASGSDELRKGLETNPFVMAASSNSGISLQLTADPKMTLGSIIKVENSTSKNLFSAPQILTSPTPNLFSNPQVNPSSTLVSNGILFSNASQVNKPAMEDESSSLFNNSKDIRPERNLFTSTNLGGNNLQLPWNSSGILPTGNILPQITNNMIGGNTLMNNSGPSNLFMSSSANDMRNEDSQKNIPNQLQQNLFGNPVSQNRSQLFNSSSNFPISNNSMLFDDNANRLNSNVQTQNNLFSSNSGNILQGSSTLFGPNPNFGPGTSNTFLNNLSQPNPGSAMPNLFSSNNGSNGMGGGNIFNTGMNTNNQPPQNSGGFPNNDGNQGDNAFLQGTVNQRTYKTLKGIRSNPGPRMNDL